MSLRKVDGSVLYRAKQKTGFLGFLLAIQSIEGLFAELIEETHILKYLLTYKFSQDHLELFFAAVRSSGGCNNNPTAKQFMAIYKRLLIRHEVATSGNATAVDNTKILEVIKDYSDGNRGADISDMSNIRRYDLVPQQPIEDLSDAPSPVGMTEYSKAAIGYIAGYVVTMAKKIIHCPRCIQALTEQDGQSDETFLLLVRHKTNGGLVKASPSVFIVCESTEACIRRMLASNNQLPQHGKITSAITSVVLNEVVPKGVFSSLQDHQFDTPVEANHLLKLVKCVSQCFVKVRMHHLAKQQTADAVKDKLRKRLSKLILFNNQ